MDRGDADRPHSVGARIRALEQKAESSALAYRARLFNRAGDACASAGDLDGALRLWGRAIDAYLQVARRGAAAATCRKAINRAPRVVRARCTLAILSVGVGDADTAIREMEAYVRAAKRAGREDLAVRQLRMTGRATDDPRIRARFCELLRELREGDDDASPDEALGRPLKVTDRWPMLMLAAHIPPDETWRA